MKILNQNHVECESIQTHHASNALRSLRPTIVCLYLMIFLVGLGFTAKLFAEEEPAKPEEKMEICEIKIEGKAIEQLILEFRFPIEEGRYGLKQAKISKPGEIIKLPAGEYRVKAVVLDNGYFFVLPAVVTMPDGTLADVGWFEITSKEPCTIRAGAPLTPHVSLERIGQILRISYSLCDSEGRIYGPKDFDETPRYSITSKGLVMGSGILGIFRKDGMIFGSWRVPSYCGNNAFKVTVANDIGDLGQSEIESDEVQWKWYYQLPSMLMWLPLFLLLLTVKENRNWQGATISVPILILNVVAFPFILRVIPGIVGHEYIVGYEITTLLAVWGAVWLLMPVLVNRFAPEAIFVVLAFTVVLGLASHIGNFGMNYFEIHFSSYLLMVLVLILSMILGAVFCRKSYFPGKFLGWMLFWSLLSAGLISFVIFFVSSDFGFNAVKIIFERPAEIFQKVVFPAMIYGAVAYVINLPFMFWMLYSPMYAQYFMKILCLPEIDKSDSDEGVKG